MTHAFQNIFDESKHQPNKIQEDKESEFYNNSIKSWLWGNDCKSIQHITKKNLLLLKDSLDS